MSYYNTIYMISGKGEVTRASHAPQSRQAAHTIWQEDWREPRTAGEVTWISFIYLEGEMNMDKFGDGIKKILLAGVGAVAVTAEKSKELLDEMVEKGELTVEQGKVLNEELKHNIKKTVKEKVGSVSKPETKEDLEAMVEKLTPEQMDELMLVLQKKQAEAEDDLFALDDIVEEEEAEEE